MDKENIRIPKYVVKVLAEKLQEFIEDNEKSFKFHPWQVTSTLNKIQKSIHPGLPERAIHHLHDTGTAHEIFKFSKKNEKPIKLGKVKNYLYSRLGIYSNMARILENGCQIVYKESQTYDAMRRNRIFEIRRLVDAIVHQLEQTSTLNGKSYHLQLNNLRKYSPQKVPKQQALAHCNYTCCLFYGRKNRTEKIKIIKKTPRVKTNFIKRNIKTTSQKIPHSKFILHDSLSKTYLSPRNVPTLVRSKTLVDSTTQTTWSLHEPRRDSLYEDEVVDISNDDESMESDSEFYCKSDTLNDASMITEEVASDFRHDVVPSEVRNVKFFGRSKSSRTSTRSKTSGQPISTKEITKTHSENYVSHDSELNNNSISSLRSVKLEDINNTVSSEKSIEQSQTDNNDVNLKSIIMENSQSGFTHSKSSEFGATQNNHTNSKSVDLEVVSQKSVNNQRSTATEVISNNRDRSNSSKLETVKASEIHSKTGHSNGNKDNTIHSNTVESEKVSEIRSKTDHMEENKETEKIENNANNLKSAKAKRSAKNLVKNIKNHLLKTKFKRALLKVPTDTARDSISNQQNQENGANEKSNLLTEITSSSIRKSSLSRCKTSLLESMEDQLEQKEFDEKLQTDVQANEVNNEQKSPTNNALPLTSEDLLKEQKDDEILKILPSSQSLRKFFGNSFESVINSENDTTYCPKSSAGSVTDEESERSSIKENDNVSLEYSSHWTLEYSLTEASDTEDDEFDEKFREYKQHLLEDDEGIAASCEEESSFAIEHHMKEMVVMSVEDKRTLMMAAKEKDENVTFSYSEDTSYLMNTETYDETFEKFSNSIEVQEGSYPTESPESSCTPHVRSSDNNTSSPNEEVLDSKQIIDLQNEGSLENAPNDGSQEPETDEGVGIDENTGNEDVSCNKNIYADKDYEASFTENLQTSHEQDGGENSSKDHTSPNKTVLRDENETTFDAEDMSFNESHQERNESPLSLNEIAKQNSQEIENISKILEDFPLRRRITVTESNDRAGSEDVSMKDAVEINRDSSEPSELPSKTENTDNKSQIGDKNEEYDNGLENNDEETKDILHVSSSNLNTMSNDNNSEMKDCEDIQSKDDNELKDNDIFQENDQRDENDEAYVGDLTIIGDDQDEMKNSENEDNMQNSENEGSMQNSENEGNMQNSENEGNMQNSENEDNMQNSENEDNMQNSENEDNVQNSENEDNMQTYEDDVEEKHDDDSQLNMEDQESLSIISSKDNDDDTQGDSYEKSVKSSARGEENEDTEAISKDEIPSEGSSSDNLDDNKSDLPNEINENIFSEAEGNIVKIEVESKEYEDFSENEHKLSSNQRQNIFIETDIGNESEGEQSLDCLLNEDDCLVDKDEDGKPNKEVALLKAHHQMNKKSHSADEDMKTKHLLKVLSLTDAQPFEDIDMMHENLLEIVDVDGWNMLHLAASKGLEKFLMKLLEHGLSTEDLTDSNQTALQLAIMNNNLKCCQILLKHGASLTSEEGSLDEDFIENACDLAPNVKDLLENYKCSYKKIEKLAEILNDFSSEKKNISRPLPKSVLPILADIIIEEDQPEENNIETNTT